MWVQIAPNNWAVLGERTWPVMPDDSVRACISIFQPKLPNAGEMLSADGSVGLGRRYPSSRAVNAGSVF